MKKLLALSLLVMLSSCVSYPYGMTKLEWEALSHRERAGMRREFFFVEKGSLDINKYKGENLYINMTSEAPKDAEIVAPKVIAPKAAEPVSEIKEIAIPEAPAAQ